MPIEFQSEITTEPVSQKPKDQFFSKRFFTTWAAPVFGETNVLVFYRIHEDSDI